MRRAAFLTSGRQQTVENIAERMLGRVQEHVNGCHQDILVDGREHALVLFEGQRLLMIERRRESSTCELSGSRYACILVTLRSRRGIVVDD
jgi:hypothetical protein